jgi:putative addiction module CopG family antidote
MRNIINISLSKELSKVVDKAVKQGKFSTKSEFFRNLIRRWEEEQVLAEIEESEREIKAGKGIKLRSLRDLR